MNELLSDVKKFLKFQDIRTSGLIFRVHCSFTTAVLITCSVLVTAKEFVGSPILCITDHNPVHPINTYCWVKGTYTIPYANNGKGIQGLGNDFGDERKYHNYYQWVCFVLFGQALLCYTPKLIWEHFEGGLIRSLIGGLTDSFDKEEIDLKKNVIIDYLLKYTKLHNKYAIIYWLCEFLCLINIILQLFLMDWFLDGEFMKYGWRVLSLSEQDHTERRDPMIHVFPRLTKCHFEKYGPSGSIQIYDNLCVLPLNVINEKTYIFIWFWFFILLCLLNILVTSRIFLCIFSGLRVRLLYCYSRTVPKEVCRIVTEKVDIGDWWILYLLRNNINQLIFRDIIFKIAKEINESEKDRNKKDDFYLSQFELQEKRLYPSLN